MTAVQSEAKGCDGLGAKQNSTVHYFLESMLTFPTRRDGLLRAWTRKLHRNFHNLSGVNKSGQARLDAAEQADRGSLSGSRNSRMNRERPVAAECAIGAFWRASWHAMPPVFVTQTASARRRTFCTTQANTRPSCSAFARIFACLRCCRSWCRYGYLGPMDHLCRFRAERYVRRRAVRGFSGSRLYDEEVAPRVILRRSRRPDPNRRISVSRLFPSGKHLNLIDSTHAGG